METDWTQEFDGFADAAATAAGGGDHGGHGDGMGGGGRMGQPKTRNERQIEELEQELKLLHWHKLANEAALKAALIRTKKLKEQDSGRAVVETRKETAQWMQQIIEEEQSKPLEVTEDFILKYEAQQREQEERLEEEVQRHIESLQRIKSNLKQKEEMRRRTHIYREKRKALLEGGSGSMGSLMGSSMQQAGGGGALSLPELAGSGGGGGRRGGPGPMTPNMGQAGAGGMQGTLSKVISSLDKLVDLEKRIARLETDVDGADGQPKTKIKFTKRRQEATPTQAAKNVFTVKHVPVGRSRHGHGGGSHGHSKGRGGGGGGGGSRGSGGTRGSRGRGGGSGRYEEDELYERDEQRSDAVMDNWLDKKKSQEMERAKQRRRNAQRNDMRMRSKKGGGEPKMQNFGDIRREFDDKKERMRRRIAQGGDGVGGGRGGRRQRKAGKRRR
jgi:hypothetical protein